ncbi:hypothetical protein KIL84_006824 [Mauremys mutica]|uniref:Uncharacterized protein n=1 Tax=Mauremys mutica TaxID=74926 RepID=A0A9D3X1M6_9SAUR|nr:hypothetical protein KIL84_006824 [Mauremys mutica]
MRGRVFFCSRTQNRHLLPLRHLCPGTWLFPHAVYQDVPNASCTNMFQRLPPASATWGALNIGCPGSYRPFPLQYLGAWQCPRQVPAPLYRAGIEAKETKHEIPLWSLGI